MPQDLAKGVFMARGKKPANGKIVTGAKTVTRKLPRSAQAVILAAGARQPTRRPTPSRPPRVFRAG
jgi:hypothetical protein